MVEKYVKKRVVVDVLKWTGDNPRDMFNFLESKTDDDLITTYGKNFYIDHDKVYKGLIIKTLEGEHLATVGDYIIKGVSGEFYPCKPKEFYLTYEKVSRVD